MFGKHFDLNETTLPVVEELGKHMPGGRIGVMMGFKDVDPEIRKSRADARRVPIIALTANAFDEDVQRSLQAGLNAHLSKPVEPNALFETLKSLISE